MNEPAATYDELRRQILANAMKAFPKVVEDYIRSNNVARPRAEDIFDIVTFAGAEVGFRGVKLLGGYTATITHGDPWEFQTCLDSSRKDSRYEAMLNLLESTEILLAEKIEDEKYGLDDMGMVQKTYATVDKSLLMGTRPWDPR